MGTHWASWTTPTRRSSTASGTSRSSTAASPSSPSSGRSPPARASTSRAISTGPGTRSTPSPTALRPSAGTGQILLFIGLLEALLMKDSANGAEPGEFVGDFRNGYIDFGWDNFDEETKLVKRGIELNNGRAAMMGILGLMVHEQLGGELPLVGQM